MPVAIPVIAAVVAAGASQVAANQKRQDAKGAAGEARRAQEAQLARSEKAWTPYQQAGFGALSQMQEMNKPGYQMQGDPGYEFAQSEAAKAINRGASAGGFLNSGRLGMALQERGQQLANSQFGDRYSRLATLSNYGQNAASGLSGTGQQVANNVGNIANNLAQQRGQYWDAAAEGVSNIASAAAGSYGAGGGGMFGGGGKSAGAGGGQYMKRSRSYGS